MVRTKGKTAKTEGKMTQSKGTATDVTVFGVVQGVGFRPFIYRIAKELGYTGWVKNIGRGVEVHLESKAKTDFEDFFAAFEKYKPPLAQVEDIQVASSPSSKFHGCKDFVIKKTKEGGSFVFISPDISICKNCKDEMMSPTDRRHHYPFINCTDCGPRYTIVEDLPYDRAQTTMRSFIMCDDCRTEYENPLDRRYHAQPVACPVCGPKITLMNAKTKREIEGGITKATSLIKAGKILAIKGLGGFHLVCDPFHRDAVRRLRKIKARKTKPLALMARDIGVVKTYAAVDPAEEKQLLSARRPIVLLKKVKDIRGIAPHLEEIGFMLPYTPLHYLILERLSLIVATSSNQKDSPIMKDVEEGIEDLCDYILTHDRPIHMRADDSVMKVVVGEPLFLRRARGYVPYPQKVPEALRSPHHILALGGELKDTISIYKNGYVVTSQFLGDLDDYKNFQYFEETIAHLARLFELKPKVMVSDLHPNFHTTRYAERSGLRHIQVQHHYAHVLAALLEHKIPPGEKVLGISMDGYGYGEDDTAWGAEFLLADYDGYERLGHFKYVPLPGGDLAAKQPWRMALAYMYDTFCGMNESRIFKSSSERIGYKVFEGAEGRHSERSSDRDLRRSSDRDFERSEGRHFERSEGRHFERSEGRHFERTEKRDINRSEASIEDRPREWTTKEKATQRTRAKKILAERIEESLSLKRVSPRKRNAVVEMIERNINSPMASSCGRLFDAVSFLVGLAPKEMEFEAEAPMRIESASDDATHTSYRFQFSVDKNWGLSPISRGEEKGGLSPTFQISFNPTIKAILDDLKKGIPVPHISAKFHNTLARTVLKAAERVRQEHHIDTVILSGGVFLNKRFLTTTLRLLDQKGFKTLRPVVYSPNDESISVGQIAFALNMLQKQKS